jgi:hypothetical protein
VTGFRGKIFWTLEIPFKTGFTVKKRSRDSVIGIGTSYGLDGRGVKFESR